MRIPNRQDDEITLDLLAMKSAVKAQARARALGFGESYMRVLRRRVMAEDLAHSAGEDPDTIRAAYAVSKARGV